jgi:hypothetical protein
MKKEQVVDQKLSQLADFPLRHRMDSTPLQRMGPEDDFTPRQLKQAMRDAALTFHSDRPREPNSHLE